MAQIVGYHQDNIKFEEGPFVIVNANGWRIEAEMKGHHCPVLPCLDIYRLLQQEFGRRSEGKTSNQAFAEEMCDWLNHEVRLHHIILEGKQWVPNPDLCQKMARSDVAPPY
jgi:hypothetical protein